MGGSVSGSSNSAMEYQHAALLRAVKGLVRTDPRWDRPELDQDPAPWIVDSRCNAGAIDAIIIGY